jgi:hypothetical protein
MGNSSYIFDQSKSALPIVCVFTLIFLGVGLYHFHKIAQGSLYFMDGRKSRWPIAIWSVGIALIIPIIVFNQVNKFDRIKKFRADTVGTTVELQQRGRNQAPIIKCKFSTKNGVFYGYCHSTKMREDNIKIPGGHYKVIYNYKNPLESVMDFQIEEDENGVDDNNSNY